MSQSIYIVGLGNPGPEYEGTRHNIGFDFVDKLAKELGLSWDRTSKSYHNCHSKFKGLNLRLIKPMTFMNRSGGPVLEAIKYYKDFELSECRRSLLVVHDELDFKPGVVRLKTGGGSGGHNGLKSLTANLGTDDYLRLRIGIGHPRDFFKDQEIEFNVSNWVLGKMTNEDRMVVEEKLVYIVGKLAKNIRDDLDVSLLRVLEESLK